MKLKQSVKNFIVISSLYLVVIGGILLWNARMEQLNNQKMTESVAMNQSKK